MSKLNGIKIILGCSIMAFCSAIAPFGYPGVMSSYWKEKFNVGNGETGLVVTFMLLALSLAMFISGRIHAKLGMIYCIIIGNIIAALGYILIFVAKNIYWIYAWGFIANFGLSFLYGPGLTTVQQVFPNKRGLVSGILNLLFGISGAIMSPLLNSLLNGPGYTFTNIFVLIIICSVISCFLLRVHKHSSKNTTDSHEISYDLTAKEAIKTKQFWTIWLIWSFVGAAGISMVSLSKSYSLYIGETGVIILTAFNLANGICRIFVGWISDIIGTRYTGAIAFLLATIGYIVAPHTSNVFLVCICVIGVGIGFGTLFTVSGPLASKIFGLKNFGTIYGLIFTGYGVIGGVVGPAVSGFVLEKTDDNYTIVFSYLAVMAFLGILLIMSLQEKKIEKKMTSDIPLETSVEVKVENESSINETSESNTDITESKI